MPQYKILLMDADETLTFERKAVALIKPVIDLDEDDFADVTLEDEE